MSINITSQFSIIFVWHYRFEYSCIYDANKLQPESLHSYVATQTILSEIQFWTIGSLDKDNKFLNYFKACITLHLSNTF